MAHFKRRYPIGAEYFGNHGTNFRVWAPRASEMSVQLIEGGPSQALGTWPLLREDNGYFAGTVSDAVPGMRYWLVLDGKKLPDPASRFQPDGHSGTSEICDPKYPWADTAWKGRKRQDVVIYEMHVGTFTAEGTWNAAARELPELARLGITMIEMMPVAQFIGSFGWGYDGMNLFAPARAYGCPGDLRAFVDRAHALGIGVLLDVVYNHMGPGNTLGEFSADYFSRKHKNEWGEAINFDGPNAAPVREFFVSNARYWIEEFHFDGLRIDATQQMFDESPTHILAELTRAARVGGVGKTVFLVAENEAQDAKLIRPIEVGGYGFDLVWNDDFHRIAHVNATGTNEAYFSGFRGHAQEFVSTVKYGFLYQGQWYQWQHKRRGTPAVDVSKAAFVHFLQNHDQIANAVRGMRLHQKTSPAKMRALTTTLLLSPQIPLLFQGQEFAASTPFQYFADYEGELAEKVAEGRLKFLAQFPSAATEAMARVFPPPCHPDTFAAAKLNLTERRRNQHTLRLHGDLLRLRREDSTLSGEHEVEGAVLSENAFAIRYWGDGGQDDRLLVVNLGTGFTLSAASEPLLAPPEHHCWEIHFTSEHPEYGGDGTPDVETTAGWRFPPQAAILLRPGPRRNLEAIKTSERAG